MFHPRWIFPGQIILNVPPWWAMIPPRTRCDVTSEILLRYWFILVTWHTLTSQLSCVRSVLRIISSMSTWMLVISVSIIFQNHLGIGIRQWSACWSNLWAQITCRPNCSITCNNGALTKTHYRVPYFLEYKRRGLYMSTKVPFLFLVSEWCPEKISFGETAIYMYRHALPSWNWVDL